MATYGEIVTQVANDLARSNISAEIGDEINAAIRDYDTRRVWFNEKRDLTFSTVAAQDIYTSADNSNIPNLIRVDAMFSTLSSDKWIIEPMDAVEMERMSPPNDSGRPGYYAYFGQSIRLWPYPDAVYTIRVLGWYRLSELANDSDTNIWTQYVYGLLRLSAKRRVLANVIGDIEQAIAVKQLEDEAWAAIDRETILRRGAGLITPTDF